MRLVTLVVKLPAGSSNSYMAKVKQIVSSLADYDLKVLLLVENGERPELYVGGDVVDLRRVSVRDAVLRILRYSSIEVSDPEMLNKLAGAAINERGELVEAADFEQHD